jgi:hypothetical protein
MSTATNHRTMGVFDSIRSVLGIRAEQDATSDADPDDLFGMSTAYVTMEANLGFEPTGHAALCFGDVNSHEFAGTVTDVRNILATSEAETGTVSRFVDDDHGYRWVVFEDDGDFEDLVTNVYFAADTFIEEGYGSRLLAAVFAFERDGQPGDWIYSFRRGSFYPFAPKPNASHERDNQIELKLQSVLDGELDVESDKEYWYPLWPSEGRHSWE